MWQRGGQALNPQFAAPTHGDAGDPGAHQATIEGNMSTEDKKRIGPSDKWMIVLTAIIAVATGLNVWIFYLESEDTSKKIGELSTKAGGIVDSMNTALSNSQDAVSKAFKANKDAVDASAAQGKRALDASIKDSQRALRPYVYVSALSLIGTLAEGQQVHGQASVVNGGRTPATGSMECADLILMPSTAVLGDNFPCPAPGNPAQPFGGITSVTVIGPNNPPIMINSRVTAITPSIPGTLVPAVTSGAFRLYFFGEITY